MKVGARYFVVEPSLTRIGHRPAPAPAAVRKTLSAAEAQASYNRMLAEQGPAKWAELHRRALAFEGSDDSTWLIIFASKLPCGDCKQHWQEMVLRTPPDWSRYFAWTVDRHNEVNRRLGKPELTEPAARTLLQAPSPAVATPRQGS